MVGLAVNSGLRAVSGSVVVVGGGGHAKVLIDAMRLRGTIIVGYVDISERAESIAGVPYLGADDAILRLPRQEILLVNGIGSVGPIGMRKEAYIRFHAQGYEFLSVIHPSAIIALDAMLGEGVQIMAGAVVQSGCDIGENAIVNTRASVDHDCRLGAHVHIAPGAVLSGMATIEEGAHVGAGAVVLQGRRIGAGSIVGAGAVIVEDVPDNVTAIGVPARVIHRHIAPTASKSKLR